MFVTLGDCIRIAVLRVGHRADRDKRITTHVALVARAFGADTIYIPTRDKKIENTVNSLCERFGGEFRVFTGVDAKKILKEWVGIIVHLTMYGSDLNTIIDQIDHAQNMLIIVGAEKVPRMYYEVADYNVAVGHQPHSEVAALALFLDRYTQGAWEKKSFMGKLNILPSARGKNVVLRKNGEK